MKKIRATIVVDMPYSNDLMNNVGDQMDVILKELNKSKFGFLTQAGDLTPLPKQPIVEIL